MLHLLLSCNRDWHYGPCPPRKPVAVTRAHPILRPLDAARRPGNQLHYRVGECCEKQKIIHGSRMDLPHSSLPQLRPSVGTGGWVGLEGALGKTRLAHMQNVVTATQPLPVPVRLKRGKIKVNSGGFSLAGREREGGREDGRMGYVVRCWEERTQAAPVSE